MKIVDGKYLARRENAFYKLILNRAEFLRSFYFLVASLLSRSAVVISSLSLKFQILIVSVYVFILTSDVCLKVVH